MTEDNSDRKVQTAIEVAVRLGVIVLLAAWCLQIVAPFIGVLAWGMVIAIGATAPFERLVTLLRGRRGFAAATFVLVSFVVLIGPAIMLSETLVSGAQHFADDISDGRLTIPPPPASTAEWPIVGSQQPCRNRRREKPAW